MTATADQLEGRLEQVGRELEALMDADLHDLPSGRLTGLVESVENIERRLQAFAHHLTVAVEADGTWAASGYRSLPTWWADRTDRRLGPTRARIRTAQNLHQHLPATEAALAAGAISADHAALMAQHCTRTSTLIDTLADPEIGEAFLVAQAAVLDADRFRRALQAWAIRADPEAADRNWVEDAAKQHLFVSETLDGFAINGWLTPENGAALRVALEAIVGVPVVDDDRTPSARLADALITLSHLALDSGSLQPGARIRPHTTVTVDAHTLHRLATDHAEHTEHTGASAPERTTPGSEHDPGEGAEQGARRPGARSGDVPDGTTLVARIDHRAMIGLEPAALEDGTPLSPGQLARLTCGSEFTRVVFGSDSQPLDVGRAQRLHNRAQTTAITARDRHCAFPGCAAPPGWGEVHHSLWWSRGGATDTHHGILLCWFHHDRVHQREIAISRHHDHWHFTGPDGAPVSRRHPPPCADSDWEPPPIQPVLPDGAPQLA
ncbi:HNH endonuclease [Ruania suaedae]|uniref:HNH endonuclease signature motif containing protein n=1 Tax=Ruania suaedae TaxID=2897774 RepID=UPI001E3B4A80|nr:HNH endonuclease signature motif containing protein [Ruania suaedae]UFU03268.1 HNH endonuclease [Ruania suaedae]